LFVPRIALEVVMAPARGAAWAYHHYAVNERFHNIFFNKSGTYGVYPIASIESGFGLNLGAHALHRNVLGVGENVSLRASFGGRFKQAYLFSAGSGDRFEVVAIGLEVGFERRAKDLFYGIGNGDLASAPMQPVDPLAGVVAHKSRFRQDIARATIDASVELPYQFEMRLAASLQTREFGESPSVEAGQAISENFDVAQLHGFEDGLFSLYNELELRFDSRRALSRFESAATPGGGWLLAGFLGHGTGFKDDPSDFYRYGTHLQRFFRIARGPRTVALRLYHEGVTGDYDDVPFGELPRLGGNFLRGYKRDRFRDRVSTLATVEYRWDLANNLAGILYADVGRVYPTLRDFTLDGHRASSGIAVQVHTLESFVMRFGIGASVGRNREESYALTLEFDPTYKAQARTARR
jgi:outer membrane protein assembly factor BamA